MSDVMSMISRSSSGSGSLYDLTVAASAMLLGAVSVVICCNVLWLLTRKGGKRGSVRLPMPPGYPMWLFGFLGGQTLKFSPGDIVGYMLKWTNHFNGDFEIMLMGKRVLSSTDPEDINFFLMQRPGTIRRMQEVGQVFTALGLGKAIFAAEGAQWGRLRRLTSSSFNSKNVHQMVPTMEMLAKRMVKSWAEQAARAECIDVKENMGVMTFALTALTGFEYDVKAFTPHADQKTMHALVQYFEGIQYLNVQPLNYLLWTYLPAALHPKKKEFFENDAHIEKLISDVIDNEIAKKKAGIAPGPGLGHTGSMVKNMIAMLESSDGATDAGTTKKGPSKLTRDDVIANMKFFFVAGRDTNGHSMSWAVYFMATHPEMQRKIQEEVDRVLGDNEAPSSYKQVKDLVYVSAVYQETLRIRQPVPFTLLEGKTDFTTPSGKSYPAGTVVLTQQAYVSLQEDSFTEAKRFCPDRWLGEAERTAALGPNANHHAERVWTFGGGPRTCPGKELATITSIVTLATVFKRFNVAMDPYHPEPEFVVIGAMQPSQVHVRLTERKRK